MSWNTYLWVALLWVLYLLIHSALASGFIKAKVQNGLSLNNRWYRFLYSVISTVGIGYVFLELLVMPSEELFVSTGWLKYVSMTIASWGVIILVVSFRHLSGLAFLGIKKEEDKGLVTEGLHGYMRHPIYTGTILILMGMFLYHPTDLILVSDLIIFIYLPFGIMWEEQKLIEEFGDSYLEYKKQVPSLIPRPFWKR
ncbi:MAG: protein-S-isoprenylcysteine methyltransferase [Rickettsiales bacterium]|nr:protein-S-isoprenylcysteine methyltransferase [Rickettsiales bacterium]